MLIRHTIFNVTVHTRRIESIQIMPIHGDSESVIGVDPFFLQSRRFIGGLWHDIGTEMRCDGEFNSFYLLISTVEVTCIVLGIIMDQVS